MCIDCATNFVLNSSGLCECAANYYYYKSSCLAACPTGYYKDSTADNICLACLKPCKVCTTDITCSVCNDGYKFVSSLSRCVCLNEYSLFNLTTCVETCPLGYYANHLTYNCEECNFHFKLFFVEFFYLHYKFKCFSCSK